MSHRTDRLRRADVAILEYLSRERPDYVPLVANRLGLHLGYAEERVEELTTRGLVEPISDEVVYRITERGEQRLVEARANGAAPTGESAAADDD